MRAALLVYANRLKGCAIPGSKFTKLSTDVYPSLSPRFLPASTAQVAEFLRLRNLQVLHVIPSVSLLHGGPSRAILAMEQALLAQGAIVTTATTDDDGPGARQLVPPAIDAAVLRRFYFRKWIDFYKVSPGLAWWLLQNVSRFDVVHIHALFSFSSVAAAWAARRASVPYVVRPLGTLNQYGMTQRRSWLKRLSLKLVEGPILRHAAAVHFTAETEREEAESLGIPMRSTVVPLGISPAQRHSASLFLQRYPELAGQRVVLFLSRLDPVKNVEGLLQAYRLMSDHLPRTTLVICGNGDATYVAGLKHLVQKLGLGARVVWAGHIDGDLKASALASATLFVLPSFSENFGIAVAEALMAGLPCVLGHGVAIAADVVNAGAGVAVAPDAPSIAAGLLQLMEDAQLRAAMAERAVALAQEKYSAQAMGVKLIALYQEILGCRQSQAPVMSGTVT